MYESFKDKIVTDFQLVSGGDLLLYIGKKIGQRELTEWRLYIESPWRITQEKNAICGSLDFPVENEDSAPFLVPLQKLIGEKILRVEIGQNIVDLYLELDKNLSIFVFCDTKNGIHWTFRHSSGKRIAGGNMVDIKEWNESSD